MTSKKPIILIRADESTKAALRKAAKADRRSMAVLAEILIIEGLQRRGHLPKP